MKLKLSAIVALALFSSVSLGAAEKLTTSTINVYSATPLPSLGLPLNIIPANIQIATPKAINAQSGVSLADYMSTNMQSVSVTEMGGNPWQPEVTFRGYSASPLLGMPQGMSTFVDGVRVNEPFGDVTLWDKIPNFAIGGMQLVPGSNPMYGLNTLGGAIAIQTKSGRQAQGVGIETEYGSWNRKRALVEYGGVSKDGSMDFYIGHQTTKEDGWRQFSPSHLNQTFAKTGWQSEKTKLDLSYIGTDNKLIGNGFTPEHMLSGDRDQIHTRPDWTNNYYHHLALNGSHWVNNDVMLSGNAYYRKSNRHTKNGDLYEYEIDGTDSHENYNGIVCDEASSAECELKGSVLNTSHTKQDNYGVSAQMTFNQDFMGMKNQFIAGTGFDYSLIRFKQNERVNISNQSEGDLTGLPIGHNGGGTYDDAGVGATEVVFDPSREAILTGNGALPQTQTVGLTGKQWTASLFATDMLSLNDKWHLNAGVRYNHTKVDNNDSLRGAYVPVTNERSLSATDDYKRLNPTIGITHTPTDKLSIFGTYSESSRAPTSIEVGCSNPAVGCLLPSAMADDPPLKQVVAKTYDFGARGSLTDEVKWNASIYHAINHQDIQFIRVDGSSSRGYYSNVGRTQRQGLDLGVSGQHDRFRWSSSYSYIRATFDSEFTLLSNPNSSAHATDNTIEIKKGNRMPSIPEHQFKARAQYDVTPQWSVGTNLVYFSDQYVMGNENNQHTANTAGCSPLRSNTRACGSGKISDYTVVNLDTQYNFGGGWKAFAKAINIFDNDYYVAGRLAETMFDASGAYGGEIKSRGVIPGAPRAAWIGVRYEFGGAPEAK